MVTLKGVTDRATPSPASLQAGEVQMKHHRICRDIHLQITVLTGSCSLGLCEIYGMIILYLFISCCHKTQCLLQCCFIALDDG